eukprot:TRINITY_DN16296_c0_g2_i1.p1 TRINITY_DN16296_c0_g2~~TRINITY_DN16296_c0_g2_i1.p1  ORF type:complete len:335 (+),score=50.20 TRINITY_DN16296_c0_g2_i1:70-1005(+)
MVLSRASLVSHLCFLKRQLCKSGLQKSSNLLSEAIWFTLHEHDGKSQQLQHFERKIIHLAELIDFSEPDSSASPEVGAVINDIQVDWGSFSFELEEGDVILDSSAQLDVQRSSDDSWHGFCSVLNEEVISGVGDETDEPASIVPISADAVRDALVRHLADFKLDAETLASLENGLTHLVAQVTDQRAAMNMLMGELGSIQSRLHRLEQHPASTTRYASKSCPLEFQPGDFVAVCDAGFQFKDGYVIGPTKHGKIGILPAISSGRLLHQSSSGCCFVSASLLQHHRQKPSVIVTDLDDQLASAMRGCERMFL